MTAIILDHHALSRKFCFIRSSASLFTNPYVSVAVYQSLSSAGWHPSPSWKARGFEHCGGGIPTIFLREKKQKDTMTILDPLDLIQDLFKPKQENPIFFLFYICDIYLQII